LDIFLEDIKRVWLLKGGQADIADLLREKITGNTNTYQVMILHEDAHPVGIGWLETLTPHYGNMILHALKPSAREPLTQAFINLGWLKTVFSELIQFDDSPEYFSVLKNSNLHENIRQRMCLDLSSFVFKKNLSDDIEQELTFIPILHAHKEITAQISVLAHRTSKDYEGYPDLENFEKRIQLEDHVYNGLFGKLVPDASLFIGYKGDVVGFCSVIELPCWGFDRTPWIFDMCIHPSCHGQGFGRRLIQEVLQKLKQEFPIVGLAVTLCNESALNLYESLGFYEVDQFSEFVELT
jgi:ribosomal protein S18 acetylase RimI-like enzyme